MEMRERGPSLPWQLPPIRALCRAQSSLSTALVGYYPLAGRLQPTYGGDRLEVDCNGQGALFAEGYLDVSANEFLEGSGTPNRSWRKLLYRLEAQGTLDVPPLVVHVIHLTCGGMILCTVFSHCLCDGIGTAQFLQSWAQLASKPNADPTVVPFHNRSPLPLSSSTLTPHFRP